MQRTRSHPIRLLGPPLAALIALLLAVLLLALFLLARNALALQGAPAAQALRPPSCYAWSLINQTGLEADGLELALTGLPTVTAVYTGAGNPFGAPAGVHVAGGGVMLEFAAAPPTSIFPADPVQMGLCAPGTLAGAVFTWRSGATDLAPALVAPGLAWVWPATDTLALEAANSSPLSLTLLALNVLDPGVGLTVDDLDASVAAVLPLVAEAITVPVDLLPGTSVAASVALDAGADPPQVGKRYLVHAQWAEYGDPAAAYDFFVLAQEASPRVLLPLISRDQDN